MDTFIIKTSSDKKHEIDKQIDRVVFATNSALQFVDNNEFKILLELLRPGYKGPNSHTVSSILLNEIHKECEEKVKEKLEGKTVSMAIDGWSNIHNEPIVCASITDHNGFSIISETIDTSGNQHNADYLEKISNEAIISAQEKYSVKIGSFVTDNAANMVKMRKNVKNNDTFLISYGCSAHYLNLLAKDLNIDGVKPHIVAVMKYFRNCHLPGAWYRAAGGKKLVMPQDVRWNSLADCIDSYITNWPILLSVCEQHHSEINSAIKSKVENISLKRNAEDYLNILKPVSKALDLVQRDSCLISECVEVWKKLGEDLSSQPSNILDAYNSRRQQAITPIHFLANIIDPKYQGSSLTEHDNDKAMEYKNNQNNCPEFLPNIINMSTKSEPFKKYLFDPEVIKNISSMTWWKSQNLPIMTPLYSSLLTAVSSSAGVERVFSTFGLVHSKLRNRRLGVDKASKLVFMYKYFNKK